MVLPPKSITALDLEITLRENIISYAASMTERQSTLLDKENSHCKNYLEETGYDKCSEKFFNKFFKDKITCIIPGSIQINLFRL